MDLNNKLGLFLGLAIGDAPMFNEAERLEAARNKKVADMMNRLNEAANGVVTNDAKVSCSRCAQV